METAAAVMRNITYEINWKIGVVSGKITPARRVESLTGLTVNIDRREHVSSILLSSMHLQNNKCHKCYSKSDHIKE